VLLEPFSLLEFEPEATAPVAAGKRRGKEMRVLAGAEVGAMLWIAYIATRLLWPAETRAAWLPMVFLCVVRAQQRRASNLPVWQGS
jgi:hypothetical protein